MTKGAIDLIISGDWCFNEFGSVLEDIAFFTSSIDVVFNFLPGTCNWVDNELIRHAPSASTSERCDSLFLNWLLDIVSFD